MAMLRTAAHLPTWKHPGASAVFATRRRTSASASTSHMMRRRLVITNLSSNDIKNGTSIILDGTPYRVMEFLHVKPGKGSAFVRTKIRNYVNGNTIEKTFRAGEPLEAADLSKRTMQFTYMDGDDFVWMDMETYEETRIPEEESWAKYTVEGMEADILIFDGRVIGVQIPKTLTLEVTETDPGVKGNTAQGGSKPATLASGAVVQVPLFVAIGDKVTVDTVTDQYLSRSK